MTVRRLTADDTAAYRQLRLEALLDSPTAFGSSHHEEAEQPWPFFADRLASGPDQQMFGAFMDSALVGLVGVGREPAAKERHRATIRSMYVAPSARGRGVAAALLDHALAAADAMAGVWQVVLVVTAGNEPALALYRSRGFTPYGTLPSSLFVDGRYHDDVLMIRIAAGAESSTTA